MGEAEKFLHDWGQHNPDYLADHVQEAIGIIRTLLANRDALVRYVRAMEYANAFLPIDMEIFTDQEQQEVERRFSVVRQTKQSLSQELKDVILKEPV